MTGNDIAYFRMCHAMGFVRSPLLDVGSAKVQKGMPNACDLARQAGVERVVGVDLAPGEGVDITFDFSLSIDVFREKWTHGSFSTVVVFNVLEHTMDPVAVLQNVLHCTDPLGTVIVVTPSVWPLHNYPGDCLRLMPHWYEAFAERFGLKLHTEVFCWLSQFGICKVADHLVEGAYQLPSFLSMGRSRSALRYWVSRYVHRAFNTFGRSHIFTHAAVGAVFSRVG